ncbi:SLC13 family permease [Radiobacillus deserti]|uniref:SLC13 family permease n=1 Tax=Radiobacillus deserti TaxID=2594883 RepID=A0A516KHL5_9BACI|nr:SLC13 family permease [Radiobacillus deserti]QDP40879.1 SLC13 family permease [Radiobacillus deserti]
MTWEMIYTVIVVFMMMVCLIKEITRPEIIVFVALTCLLGAGVITTEEAIAGFANEGMLTVALLFIVAGTIQKSGLMERTIAKLVRSSDSPRRSLIRLVVPITGVSAFLNNTPIVATLTPIIHKWCQNQNLAPSKFLIPLSYASILGGILTVMGTSTNLVVHGLLLENGMEGYSLFTLAPYSLPACLLGLGYLVTVGFKLLPSYKVSNTYSYEKEKEYLMEMIVEDNYPYLDNPIINKTVEEANLHNLDYVYLIAIIRNEERIYPVNSSTMIKGNDHLIFTGQISKMGELDTRKGLTLSTGTTTNLERFRNGKGRLMEVVLSHQSNLLYQRIRDTDFRTKYDAGVIAIHRNRVHMEGKIGEIVLRPGDTLVLLTGKDFEERLNLSHDFYMVTPVESYPFLNRMSRWKAWGSMLIMALMIFFVSFHLLSMFAAMSIAVVLYLLLRIISIEEAKSFIQPNVLLLIASAFGIGEALLKTGAASLISTSLIHVSLPYGEIGVLFFLSFITVVFTEIITNNAAAVFMFPIALEAANQLQQDPLPFFILITISASASFLSPIGYQTNLIVYHPGGYRFSDYFKVGLPLSLIVIVTTIVTIYWIEF